MVKTHVRKIDIAATKKIKSRLRNEARIQLEEDESLNRYLDTQQHDYALHALYEMLEAPAELIIMKGVENVPHYTAWVPLKHNYAIQQADEEERMAKLESNGSERYMNALDTYEQLRGLQDGYEDDPSLLLSDIRFQQSQATAVIDGFNRMNGSNNEEIILALCEGLSIDKDTLHRIYRTATEEVRKVKARKEKLEKRKETSKLVEGVIEDTNAPRPGQLTAEALTFFCFICMIFNCNRHDDKRHKVHPTVAIADPFMKRRKKKLDNGVSCGTKCFIAWCVKMDWNELEDKEIESYTAEEESIIREVIPVLGEDPCSLVPVVGSRSCRSIFTWLEMEKIQGKKLTKKAEKIVEKALEPKSRDQFPSDDEEEESDCLQKEFFPCSHRGKCTPDNCSCLQRELPCESGLCSCTSRRYCQGKNGIFRIERKSALCENIFTCDCVTDKCGIDSDCACINFKRSCEPELCKCRQCSNIPYSVMARKRTIIGKSPIHGFGIFAATRIEKNEFIGLYTGELLDSYFADVVGAAYASRRQGHTFLFDIAESKVVDGTTMGSKTKYLNHGQGEAANCFSTQQRHRGVDNLALFAKRRIHPGEELLFDYKFSEIVPDWMGKKVTKNNE